MQNLAEGSDLNTFLRQNAREAIQEPNANGSPSLGFQPHLAMSGSPQNPVTSFGPLESNSSKIK